MFRIFKSLFELKRIQIIRNSNTDNFLKITNIVSRSFYLLYWLCDNIYIFMKACDLHKMYPTYMPLLAFRKLAKVFWRINRIKQRRLRTLCSHKPALHPIFRRVDERFVDVLRRFVAD